MSDNHSQAVEAAFKAAAGNLTPINGPLLELVRALALQMDAAGEDGPSTRLSAAYLSALKDFNRVAGTGISSADPVDELKKRRRALRAVSG